MADPPGEPEGRPVDLLSSQTPRPVSASTCPPQTQGDTWTGVPCSSPASARIASCPSQAPSLSPHPLRTFPGAEPTPGAPRGGQQRRSAESSPALGAGAAPRRSLCPRSAGRASCLPVCTSARPQRCLTALPFPPRVPCRPRPGSPAPGAAGHPRSPRLRGRDTDTQEALAGAEGPQAPLPPPRPAPARTHTALPPLSVSRLSGGGRLLPSHCVTS